jgi:hypothetical protein
MGENGHSRKEKAQQFRAFGGVQVPLLALVRTPPCRAWEDGGRLGPRSETFHFGAGFQGPFRVLSGHPTHARNVAEVVVSQTFTSSCRVPRRRAAAQFESPPSAPSSSITFATCPDDRRARRKVLGRVPVLPCDDAAVVEPECICNDQRGRRRHLGGGVFGMPAPSLTQHARARATTSATTAVRVPQKRQAIGSRGSGW